MCLHCLEIDALALLCSLALLRAAHEADLREAAIDNQMFHAGTHARGAILGDAAIAINLAVEH